MIENDNELRRYEEAYLAALALYDVLRTSGMVQVRRAELRQGEVKAEPIDFVCDIETHAARTLDEKDQLLKWWDVLEETWRYPDLPKEVQQSLGKAFLENDMGVEGDYRTLYFRIRNQIKRRALKEAADAGAEQLFTGEGNFETNGCDIPYRIYDVRGLDATSAEAGGVNGETDQGTAASSCDPEKPYGDSLRS